MALPVIDSRPEKVIDGITCRWNAANLPLQYQISNTKWPANSDDATTAITSVTNEAGYAEINFGSSTGLVAKEWLKITGTTSYNGIHQIREVIGNNLVIDFPYSSSETGTGQKYYQNYTTLVRVYAGLDAAHEYQADKPMTLIGTMEIRPDTDNITYADVRDYVKNQINTNYDDTLDSWPNDINIWCDFYIETAERYDEVSAGVVTDYTSSYVSDSANPCKAVHAALQFGNVRGGNLFEYVIFESSGAYYDGGAEFMTFFNRPKIIDYNEFNISIIINEYELYPTQQPKSLQIKEYDQNGTLLATTEETITAADYGVYRIPIGIVYNDLTTYIQIAVLDVFDIEISETKTIDVDVECYPLPEAPSDFTAEVQPGTTMEMSWVDNQTATELGYVIQKSTDGVIYSDVDTVAFGLTTYSLNSPSNVDTYYRVALTGGTIRSSAVLVKSWVAWTTEWNDSSASDGAYNLPLTSTPTTGFTWKIEGGNTYTTKDLTVPADTGDLDGTPKIIILERDDLTVITQIEWVNKKPYGVADFRGLDGASLSIFSVNDTAGASSLTGSLFRNTEITGPFNWNRNSIAGVLDLTGINFQQSGVSDIKLFGSPITGLTFNGTTSGTTDNSTSTLDLRSTTIVTLDLSSFTSWQKGSFNVSSISTWTTFIPPTGAWTGRNFTCNDNTALTAFDLSNFTPSNNGNWNFSGCTSLSTFTLPTSVSTTTGTLTLSSTAISSLSAGAVCTFGGITITSVASLTTINATNLRVTGTFKIDVCNVAYFDITPIYSNWDGGINVQLQNNNMTATEVNHFLVDMDGQVTGGSGSINIAGTNAAPDGTSGGFDGTTAKANLIANGITVTTS